MTPTLLVDQFCLPIELHDNLLRQNLAFKYLLKEKTVRKQRILWYLSEKDGGIEGSDGSSEKARAGSNDEDAIVGKKEDEIKREKTSEDSSESGGAESPTTVTAERPHQVNKDTRSIL